MKMLAYNPDDRPTAKELLKESYFKEERDVDHQITSMNIQR